MSEKKQEEKRIKEATVLFADIIGCSVVSDNYTIKDYNKFLNNFHESAIQCKKMFVSRSQGWSSEKMEFSVRGDETCLILHSVDKKNDIETTILFAIFLNFFWLVNKENQERIKADKLPRELGIGINQGFVWYDDHLLDEGINKEYEKKKTSEGYTINLAKRIEGASRNGRESKVFVSEEIKCIAEKLPLTFKFLKMLNNEKESFFISFDEGKRYDDLKGISNPPYIYEIINFGEIINFSPLIIQKIRDLLIPSNSKFPIDKYIEIAETNPHNFWLRKIKPFLKLIISKEEVRLLPKKKTAEGYFNEGVKALYFRKYEEAISLLKEATNIKSDFYEAWIRLGNAYFKMKKYDEAIKYYKKASEINAQQPDSWHNLGLSYHLKEDKDNALHYYQMAIKNMPGNYDSWYNIAQIYAELNEKEKCVDALLNALILNPTLRDNAKKNPMLKRYLKDLKSK
jgi:tetratricopeptide (TPR) repeat protein